MIWFKEIRIDDIQMLISKAKIEENYLLIIEFHYKSEYYTSEVEFDKEINLNNAFIKFGLKEAERIIEEAKKLNN